MKGAWGELDSRKAFPGTMTRGVSYTGPSFRVGWRAAGGGGGGVISIFQECFSGIG